MNLLTKDPTRRVIMEFLVCMKFDSNYKVFSVHETQTLKDFIALYLGGPRTGMIDNCEIFMTQFLSGLSLVDLMKVVLVRTRCEFFIASIFFFSGLFIF